MDAAAGEVRLDRVGDRSVAQLGEGGLFPRLVLAAVDAQLGDAAGVHGGGGEPAPGADFGQLMMITHEQHPAAGGDVSGDHGFQGADVSHPGLVDDEERL